MPPVVLDITELLRNPIRTGIQRVVRELIRYWPTSAAAQLAHFDSAHGLVPVSDRVRSLLLDNDASAALTTEALRALIEKEMTQRKGDRTSSVPRNVQVFVPEVFFDPERCDFYRSRIANDPLRTGFLVYDLIPWLHPEQIGVSGTAPLMPYLTLLRDAKCTSFISGRTRNDYLVRLRRGKGAAGPILPLGSDGLALERQTFRRDRSLFVAIGSIDGRKHQGQIVTAFQQLWATGAQWQLAIVGRPFAHTDPGFLEAARADPQFTWLADASDEAVRKLLRQARSTIYVSQVEGYGLPPVESLHAGIPVITIASVPSVADIPPHGQIRLSEVTPGAIATVVRQLADDEFAAVLWEETSSLHLPTWSEFARRAAAWVAAGFGEMPVEA